MTDRGSQSDLNSRAGFPDRLQPPSPALAFWDQEVPFAHSQDRAPVGVDVSPELFKAHQVFSVCLEQERRKKGR